MNERIRELAEQAGYKPLPGFDFANSLEETYLKKFAELIVKECISVIEVKMPEFTCKEDYDNLIRKAGRMDAIDEIKEHFGVEQHE